MAMKRIAAMLLTLVLLLVLRRLCAGWAQRAGRGKGRPGSLLLMFKPATDFTAKANAAIYDELDFDDKQEYEFATRGTDSLARRKHWQLKDEDREDPLESKEA